MLSWLQSLRPQPTIYCTWTDSNRDYSECLTEPHPDDPDSQFFEQYTVPGGAYVRETVPDGRHDAIGIGSTLDRLAREYPLDPTRPRIEIYTDSDDVVVLSPVVEGVNP